MDTFAAADRLELDIRRGLLRLAVVEPLERTAVLCELAHRIGRLRDHNAATALAVGASYAAVGRALGVSRQAVRQRLRAPGTPPTAVIGSGTGVVDCGRRGRVASVDDTRDHLQCSGRPPGDREARGGRSLVRPSGEPPPGPAPGTR